MNARKKAERQEQLRRIDAWLNEFRRTSPVLFTIFAAGVGLFFAGMVLFVLELLERSAR